MKLVGAAAAACVVLTLASGCGADNPIPTAASGRASATSDPSASSSARAGDGPSGLASSTVSGSARAGDPEESSGSSGSSGSSSGQPDLDALKVSAPSSLTEPLLSSDFLVSSRGTIPDSTIEKIRKLKGVVHVEPISLGSFYVDERQVTYAAVDPKTFWRYTPPGTAHTQGVWDRVAGGEIAVQPALAKKIQDGDGYMRLGNESGAKRAHIGAYAQILDPRWAKQIDAVVNYKWTGPLGMTPHNAMLVSLGAVAPEKLRKQLQKDANTASVQLLGPNLDTSVPQQVQLTGGSVANAIGSFNYRVLGGGRVAPDPKWVATYIRTERMPIIGTVTGNKVMLPRLQQALLEIQRVGLANKIYQYGGCYVPRYIAGTNTLSFHSFGTAIDLNVPDNQRGTRGQMDPEVVRIFKKWGFAWGGDWHYTDPMHFELARLVQVP